MKKQLLSRKKLSTLFYSLCFMALFANSAKVQAQIASDGDYRTAKVSGNWSDTDMWETRIAGAWAVTAVVPTATNNVYVQNGHTVTVDVANVYCKDLQLNIVGVLAIGVNTVNVSGKIRAYTTTLGVVIGAAANDGAFYSDQTSSTAPAATMITTINPGVLKFVGGTRNITNAGEWNANGTNNAAEFALDSGAIGTLNTVGVKFNPVVFSSGTITTDAFISASSGNLTIKSGATLISSRSGTSTVIGNSSTVVCGIVTIDAGGILELTGSAPAINCTTFTNNGSVIYSRAGTQTFLQSGSTAYTIPGTTLFNNYSTLILSNTSTKTPFAPITVSSLLKFMGTTAIAPTAINTLTMLNSSTVERSGTSTTPIPSTAGAVLYGTSGTDLINVTIGSTVSNSNEFVSSPTPGKVGTLTINSGVTYTVTGGRTAINVVNNGIIVLTTASSFTFNINGSISGTGTISGHTNASITFGGANDGNAGTLNFTTGSQVANNLTINRTGLNASVTLGTPVTILNINPATTTLGLSAGTIINSGFITLGNGAIISRSGGSLDVAPIFGTSLTLNYNSSVAKTVGYEMPNSSAVATTVNISSGAVTLNSTKNISALTLTTGSLTLSSGANLTIQNALTNNSTASAVVIESGANLIQVNNVANAGDITVKRNSSSLFRLDYTIWSSPVVNASKYLLDFSPLTLPTRFYNYNTSTNLYNAVSSPATTPFATAAGYLIRTPDNWVDQVLDPLAVAVPYSGVFTGAPNNGDIPVILNYVDATHGYNMVGNPYPSTINAETFLAANSTNIESTLYFWRKTNGAVGSAYATYTSGGATTTTPTSAAPNGTIQVGQGFFVQAKSAAIINTFFTNAMRTANTANQFFKTKNSVERNRVWLNLTNATGLFSQALVGYMTDATQGVDTGIDGKYINDSPIALTSSINNEDYTIQGRALPFDPSDVVALNFKTDVAGDYTIGLDHVDGLFAEGQNVFLKDNTTGTETDLKAGAYTFTTVAGTDNARFSLKYQKTLNIDAPAFSENSVTVYKNKGTFYVNSGSTTISNIKVFDIQGRLIAEQKNVKANSATIKDLKFTQQVLIVKITSEDNKVVSKKVVN
ncbi:MAG: T9SS sorting signal type C domain-containing protein [Flavobacterium sp.]|nr:T9SS sorting signal type C domain-containing protein [Flavobacterium sp.]